MVRIMREGATPSHATQPLKYAGMAAKAALNPLGARKKSVPQRRRVVRVEVRRVRNSYLVIDTWYLEAEDWRIGGLEVGDWRLETGDSGFSSWVSSALGFMPRMKRCVMPRVSKPAHNEGPERSARPAKMPVGMSRL